MTQRVDLAALTATLADLPTGKRTVVAIAGPPGAGKSTLVDTLLKALNTKNPNRAAVLAMDGFHYDNAVLEARGRLPFKGAPDTFDVGGLASALQRLTTTPLVDVAVPVFDRDLEVSRGSAAIVPAQAEIIIAEGNWLLLDEAPWNSLHAYYDQTILIEVPEEELRARLTKRWQGYKLSDEALAHKLDGNDLPNGRYVMERSVPASFNLVQAGSA